ncbi:unnamed protein product [Paramecium sonneborni]|uniref:Uncharacterized protein n=1 Tax=Paramecium sonneborni TaxID=65129 RepID=A0A8S1NMY9_9CILI|nr:unnamed protein product [Paramecium sonneborni]
MQYGKTGESRTCGSTILNIYMTNLDFEFLHSQSSINLMMTSTLTETPDNKSWGIRNFQLFYGVAKDCSNSIIDFITVPSFIATSFFKSSSFSHDQTQKINIEISELGISLEPDFDQTVTVDKDLKKMTISVTWPCFTSDLNFSLIIQKTSYPDYKTITSKCRHKNSNIVKLVLIIECIIPLESQIKLYAILILYFYFIIL